MTGTNINSIQGACMGALDKNLAFKIIFIIYMFTNTLALGYVGITINWLFLPILIWAVVLIISDIKNKSFFIKNHWMFFYGLILLVSTILNSYSNLLSYIIAAMQLVIFILIFYPNGRRKAGEIERELSIIIPLVNVLVGVAGLISLVMFFYGFSSVKNGQILGIMGGNRLFGIYFNCNPAAFLSCITILMAIYGITRQYRGRVLYGMNIVIQVGYILLSKCRAATIILLLITSCLITYHFIKGKQYKTWKNCIIFLGVVVGVIVAGVVLEEGAVWFQKLRGTYVEQQSRFQLGRIIEAVKLLVTGTKENIQKAVGILNKVSSGRIDLLETGYEVWKEYPILGVGANNFKRIGMAITSGTTVKGAQVVHTHNVFVEALVTTGIVGFVIWMKFFIQTVKVIARAINNSLKNMDNRYVIFTLIVVSEFIGGLFDYGVFYIYSLSATLGWMFLGYLYQMRGSDK